jgi:hypothetical protein
MECNDKIKIKGIIIIQKKCLECEKPLFCKALCKAHYVKMRRKIPEVKEAMKKYNSSEKGIASRNKFLIKNGKDPFKSKVKIITNCSCGSLSVVKGFCRICYNKFQYEKRKTTDNRKKGRKPIDISSIFNLILKDVKNGYTIEMACIKNKIKRNTLYNKMSELQKKELISYKLTATKKDINKFIL